MAFDRNHGLTPSEDTHFLDLKNLTFMSSSNASFLSRPQLNIISRPILLKNTLEKIVDFLTETMGKPLWKIPIFLDLKN